MRAYRKGKVALANAIGTGVADDKAIYAYMPRIIEYYLAEKPILANVQTNICREPEGLRYTLDHLDELVVKPVGESGGYGITVGPRASTAELAGLPRAARGRSRQLHQPADDRALGLPDADARRHRAAPRRPAAVRGHRQPTPGCCRAG